MISSFEKISHNTNNIISLDSEIAPSAVNEEFLKEINLLAPFGSGNNEPKFVIENLSVVKSNIIKNTHIKSILKGRDGSIIKSFLWIGSF